MAASRRHRGDGGETALGSGQRVRKDDPRIECVGSIDELSSFLGLAIAALAAHGAPAEVMAATLRRMQRELHRLGAELASRDGGAGAGSGIGAEHVAGLDREVEETDARLPGLCGFILPGGGVAAAHLHVARAVCRRAERQVVRLAASEPVGPHVIPYLNRLSLVLFALARLAAHQFGSGDEPV
ncbi:MAG: cob(I)yrinic acid a,c-diamide adenosyltransferase [Deltaproteobacteria bacterium]|nr:cob(I)yrinic acid a,c-diamide adenosyltransferase [Deltaproteobacteria bacterium]